MAPPADEELPSLTPVVDGPIERAVKLSDPVFWPLETEATEMAAPSELEARLVIPPESDTAERPLGVGTLWSPIDPVGTIDPDKLVPG